MFLHTLPLEEKESANDNCLWRGEPEEPGAEGRVLHKDAFLYAPFTFFVCVSVCILYFF